MSIDYSDMKFPKYTKQKKPPLRKKTRLKRSKKKKVIKIPSIIQEKADRRCYLCMLLDNNYQIHLNLEEHHVLFGNKKWISDAYGLRVNLCIPHHRTGPAAVHNNYENADILRRIAQQKFKEEFPDVNWMEIVRENYI